MELKKQIKKAKELKKEVNDEIKKLEKDLLEASKKADMPVVRESLQEEKRGFRFWKKKPSRVREMGKQEGLKFLDKQYLKRFPETTFLIEMFFSNGTSKIWVIRTKEEMFYYKGRGYYLRYEDVRFSITNNQYKLFFHEDYCTPIDKQIIRLPDKDAEDGREQAYFSVTSSNIKEVIRMKYIEALAKGGDTSAYLIITMFAAVLTLLMMGYLLYSLRGG